MDKHKLLVNLAVVGIPLCVLVSVGVVVFANADFSMPPTEGFTILKKEIFHNNGQLSIFGLGYDIPVFYYTPEKCQSVLQEDYDRYNVGDWFSGPYVSYG